MRRINALALVALMASLLFGGTPAGAAPLPQSDPDSKIEPRLLAALSAMAPGDMTTVVVTLQSQADLKRVGGATRAARLKGVIQALRATAQAAQPPVTAWLAARQGQGAVASYAAFWVFDGLSVTATPQTIRDLAARSDVRAITSDEIDIVPAAPLSAAPAEPNLAAINAPALWDLGWRGQGVVIASLDTGVDGTHPDLAPRWRGGSNSWYDPYGQHPTTPTDLNGHGTWTMGVMVGGEGGGTALGVAPQAQWIAAKIFNDRGQATATGIHRAFQWVLDPDGNANTADAPQVVNNSWTFGAAGCSLEFQLDLQALRAAGILPVFAAGNYGPGAGSSASPANNPEAFAVGAIDNAGQMYPASSRGPSACGEAASVFPELTAPGVNINTTDLFGFYTAASGTSLAAPHVSGALALLLSAYPGLSAAQQEAALLSSAVDLGPAGPDNDFGYGRLDALAAYQWLASGSGPTPTPTATSAPPTNTPVPPTATSAPPTNTPVPPTATSAPPTATWTALPPTNTPLPPTATSAPPTATWTALPPTNTPLPPTATWTALPPTATATASADLIFQDGFESGNFAAWSATSGAGTRMTVTTAASLNGTYGLQAAITGNTPSYVQDNTPAAETSYRARFYFDPNGLNPGTGTPTLFVGLNGANTVIVRVQLRRNAGQYQVRAVVARAGGNTNTAWYTVTDAAHAIEIEWASGTAAAFRLYIDGTLRKTLGNLNTSAYVLESVRLGPSAGLTAAMSGTLYFDAFVSRRATYIGP